MINYPAIFRAMLMSVASLFLVVFVVSGLREASQQRADQVTRMQEALRRPAPTNTLPMQGGWGCPARADQGSSEAVTGIAPTDPYIQ